MKEFKMYADIVYHDSFQEFMEGENVGAEDFICLLYTSPSPRD